MIDYLKVIDKKYCKDNLVQLIPCTDCCQLIMDTDEILFLKTGNNILINKYINIQEDIVFHIVTTKNTTKIVI